tara:strand:+ start:684 stop:884 length:201 start_codon:yes stop_codon:yes gene_type:complete
MNPVAAKRHRNKLKYSAKYLYEGKKLPEICISPHPTNPYNIRKNKKIQKEREKKGDTCGTFFPSVW